MALCLMYHNFTISAADADEYPREHRRYILPRALFLSHLEEAERMGWRFISPEEIISGGPLDAKSLLLTFDDSWQSHEWAGSALHERGIAGLFFLNSGTLGQPRMLSPGGVSRVARLGQEIGSHGVAHDCFDALADDALARTLADSKRALEAVSASQIRFVSLPGGRFDSRFAPAAMSAGYSAAFTSRPGALALPQRAFLLNRLPVTADITLERFGRILEFPRAAVAAMGTRYYAARISRMIAGRRSRT